jgi:GMP synthase (glutamine-hydrolysing)
VKPRHVLVLQHAAADGPGLIERALRAKDLQLRSARPFAGEPVPSTLDEVLGLVVMGGPMGVHDADRYPYLAQETRLIERALAKGLPVLGICLGSQLLASVLGAPVVRGPRKEIGWHRVTLTEDGLLDPVFKGLESSFIAFHWHGDVFSPPKGASTLARSELTECQAFRYGKSAYGILFHLEVTAEIVEAMATAYREELAEVGLGPSSLVETSAEHLAPLAERGSRAFAVFADLVADLRDATG